MFHYTLMVISYGFQVLFQASYIVRKFSIKFQNSYIILKCPGYSLVPKIFCSSQLDHRYTGSAVNNKPITLNHMEKAKPWDGPNNNKTCRSSKGHVWDHEISVIYRAHHRAGQAQLITDFRGSPTSYLTTTAILPAAGSSTLLCQSEKI